MDGIWLKPCGAEVHAFSWLLCTQVGFQWPYTMQCRVLYVLIGLMFSLLETTKSQLSLLSPCVWLAPLVSIFRKRFILSDSPTKVPYTCLLNTKHSTCPTHGVLDLIKIKLFNEEKKLRNWSLCSFLQRPITSFILYQNFFLSALFTRTFNLVFPP